MKWREVIKKLRKIKYREGRRTRHYTIWNCPCETNAGNAHPVGVGNHLTEDCRFKDFKRQLGPHLKEFGKI